MKKIIVGISAADGVQIGVRLLKLLRETPEVETHLVMSRNTDTNLRLELGMSRAEAEALADVCYQPEDLAAAKIGMDTYLVTDCLIAPEGADLSVTRHGTLDELCALVEEFPPFRPPKASTSPQGEA